MSPRASSTQTTERRQNAGDAPASWMDGIVGLPARVVDRIRDLPRKSRTGVVALALFTALLLALVRYLPDTPATIMLAALMVGVAAAGALYLITQGITLSVLVLALAGLVGFAMRGQSPQVIKPPQSTGDTAVIVRGTVVDAYENAVPDAIVFAEGQEDMFSTLGNGYFQLHVRPHVIRPGEAGGGAFLKLGVQPPEASQPFDFLRQYQAGSHLTLKLPPATQGTTTQSLAPDSGARYRFAAMRDPAARQGPSTMRVIVDSIRITRGRPGDTRWAFRVRVNGERAFGIEESDYAPRRGTRLLGRETRVTAPPDAMLRIDVAGSRAGSFGDDVRGAWAARVADLRVGAPTRADVHVTGASYFVLYCTIVRLPGILRRVPMRRVPGGMALTAP